MKKLIRYLKNYKIYVILGPLFKLLESATELTIPLLMAKIIDQGILTHDVSYIWRMGLIILILNILGFVFATVCQKCASLASTGMAKDIRKDFFRIVNTYSYSEVNKFSTATLVTRITDDVQQVESMVSALIRNVMRAPFLLIGATILAIMVNAKLSLIFLVIVPIIIITMYVIMKSIFPYYHIIRQKLDNASQITRENLSGVRVVRAFDKQKYEKKRFNTANEDIVSTQIRADKIVDFINPITFFIVDIAVLFVLWFGGKQVYVGELTTGEIIAFIEYLTTITLSIVMVARIMVVITRTSASAKRLNEVLDTTASVVEHTKRNIKIGEYSHILEFNHVSFSYDNSMIFAIKDVNLKLKKGQTLGIIGGTASGKTSIVNLIPRFFDTTLGEIYVKGVNVKDYSFRQLRDMIGIVPQKATLFSGSLRENMQFRKKNATDAEIYEALEIAQAKPFVDNWTNGLDYQIMAKGKNVSGGQMQRLTIARALVGKPDILILDDSSSALDYATDLSLRKALKKLDCTTILVSQRASSVRNADLIIVLDKGEVVGMGKHKDLVENCAVYQEIYLSQTKQGGKDEKEN